MDSSLNNEIDNKYTKTAIGVLPKDWSVLKAGDIFNSHVNKKHSGDLEVLSATQDRGIIPRNQLEIDIKYDKSSLKNYKKVEMGDFVISLRSFQGGIEYSNYEGLVSPAYTVLKNRIDIAKPFYKYLLKKEDFITRLNSVIYGIRDGKQIGYKDFKDLKIQCPPIDEQQKIAVILSTWDKAIELKEKLIEQKKEQKKGLMQKLLTGEVRLPGFEGEWEEVKIKEISKVVTGTTPSTKNREYYDDGTFPWITPTDINDNKYISGGERYLTAEGLRKGRHLPANSLLVTCIASIGKNAVLTRDGSCNQQINAILPSDNHSNDFLYYKLEKDINKLEALSGKTATSIINKKTFENYSVEMPSFEEQKAIAQVLSGIDKEILLLVQEREQLKEQKKGLMQLLLTGKVRVQV